jgi:hypothetical protein
MAHHGDRQIVEMYPRLIELERHLGWVIHATYFYSNLRKRKPFKYIQSELRVERGSLDNRNFRQYLNTCAGRRDPYQLLLDVWDKYGHQSVTSRGHIPQDWAVIAVGVTTLVACIVTLLYLY